MGGLGALATTDVVANGAGTVATGLRQMCASLGGALAEMFGNQPEVDGEPMPEMSRWSCRTLIALNRIKSERVRRSIGALIEEIAGSR
jgi:hypothetical protein